MIISNAIEVVFTLGLLVNALLFVPQAWRLYQTKSAKDISIITFAGFNVIQLATFLHGWLHHDYILMFGYLLSLITCGVVTVLAGFYRFRAKAQQGKEKFINR